MTGSNDRTCRSSIPTMCSRLGILTYKKLEIFDNVIKKDVSMRVLVIGNGFDIDLGINTSYSNFYNYSIFSKRRNVVPNSLEAYLRGRNKKDIRWADLEESMATYVKNKKGRVLDTITNHDKFFLQELKREFSDFIIDNWYNKSNNSEKEPINDSLAKRIIDKNNKGCFDSIYSFNCMLYSDLQLFSDSQIDSTFGINNIHGAYDVFIFGIRKEDCIREDYSFLVKENQDYYPHDVVKSLKKDLMLANDVVIFGHSLNRIDMGYFEYLFKQFAQTNQSITFITKNKSSRDDIISNISQYVIPYEKLDKSGRISFLYTDDYYNQEKSEYIEDFLTSLNLC